MFDVVSVSSLLLPVLLSAPSEVHLYNLVAEHSIAYAAQQDVTHSSVLIAVDYMIQYCTSCVSQ